jgi:nitroimidazol reductase NimA-like FMN-containing flavoprotein (pyridoxamine 5'-phosphate oxidase superfamily)
MTDEITVDELDEVDCAQLLESHHFGRIAVLVDGHPEIFPVNYLYHDGRVAIRTDRGTKLHAAAMSAVAFEIDATDDSSRSGWSVLVKGTGYDITDSVDDISEDLRQLQVDTWAPGANPSWIRIEPHFITGRRIRRP